MMYHTALSYLEDRDLAMDVVHDSFIILWEKYDSLDFSNPHRLRVFVQQIVRGKSIDVIRKRKWELPADIEEDFLGVGEDEHFPMEAVEQILARLDSETADLIRMRFVMDLPYEVIAKSLRIRESTARKRVNRAKQKLIRMYKELDDGQTR